MSEPVSADFAARVAERLAARRGLSKPKPVAAPAYGGLHEAAAVLAWFDPQAILPVDGASASDSVDELLADSAQAGEGGASRWTLLPDVRIAVLRQLRESGRLQRALAAAREKPDDPLQRALDGYLAGMALPAQGQQSLEDLAASYLACEWLRAAGFTGLPEADAIKRSTEWLTLLLPFEHLAGQYFRGRTRELQRLRSYAGVLPPGSVFEATIRFVEAALSLERKPPLVIFGPGGVGKSTLIARFLLEHARALEDDRFPFAYLDFDRPDIAAEEPLTLLLEAVRQLGIEYPDARAGCERIRQGWLELLARGQQRLAFEEPRIKISEGAARARSAAVRDFASLIDSLGAHDRPVLFVLDTFEEVQYRSEEHVAAIWRLLEQLQRAVPRLRVVIAGRASLPGRSTEDLPLTGLDEEAAAGYLQAHGLADPEVARRLARQIGGSPLSLKLAVELVGREGLDKSGKLDISTREFFFLQMDDALIQRQLYKRVLGHIHNSEVRKLAHPGLVLRRLTPELILDVLAEPCGLAVSSLPQAQVLFLELRREVSLVTEASDGALVHRQDLRRLMLELLQADEPDKARTIHEGAVLYYERQTPAPQGRAEEIYHRLILGQDPIVIDARWLSGVEPHLGSALPELTGARRAYLASRLNLEVDAETQRLADVEDWERIVERKARDLLAQDQAAEALGVLTARAERTPVSPIFGLQATALARLRRWPESLAVLDRGTESAIAGGKRRQALALALQAAEVVLTSGLTQEAPAVFRRLEGLADGTLSPIDRLETATRRLMLARLDPSLLPHGAGPLERELRDLFDCLPDEGLITRPPLACWAVLAFGRGDVGRLARVLRLLGVPRASPTALRTLAAELTSFDVLISQDLGEVPGALAREQAVPPRDSLTAAWTDFVLKAEDARLQVALPALLEAHAPFVPQRLMAAFASVMAAALGIERSIAGESVEWPVAPRTTGVTSVYPRLWSELAAVLTEAFQSERALRQLLLSRLDRSLDTIALQGGLREMALRVVEVAASQGWLIELFARAREALPKNAALAEAAVRLGLSALVALDDFSGAAGFSSDSVARRARLSAIEAQVCRVEAGGSFGTGFLVGVDLLLTADFVLKEIHDGKASPGDVRLLFDYKTDQRGRTVTAGTLFELDGDWLAARSEFGRGPSRLGYALLRVRNSPGAQPVGGSSAWESVALRQWIEVKDRLPAIESGEGLAMIQHAQAGPLKLTTNPEAVLGSSTDGTHLYYDLETFPGSSGAPCFTVDYDLVAFHVGRADLDPEAPRNCKVGVLMAAVLRDLHKRGLGDLLGTRFL